jgi:agmatine/peptidylarginine deiminase
LEKRNVCCKRNRHATHERLPLARRVGTTYFDLDGMAPPSEDLARSIRIHSATASLSSLAHWRGSSASTFWLDGEEVMAQAQSLVGHLDNVVLHDIPTNDAWARDFGPLFLAEKASPAVSLVDWEFNAWGGKYPAWQLDNDVPRILAQQLGLHRYVPGVVLEGGSIEGNGCGTLLTTESCLLDPRRNPHLNRSDIEHLLREYCCVSNVIWLLGGPLAGDDTDGHIDQLARFVSPHEIVVAVTDDPHDCNYRPLANRILQRLQRSGSDRWRRRAAPANHSACRLPSPIVIDSTPRTGQLLQLLHRQRMRP